MYLYPDIVLFISDIVLDFYFVLSCPFFKLVLRNFKNFFAFLSTFKKLSG